MMHESRLKSLLDDRESGAPATRIVRIMSERGALSAAQIARLTGLARSTVSMALAELRQSGIVVEVPGGEEAAKGVGRPATALTLNPEAGTCIGLHMSLDDIQLVVADVSHSVIAEQNIAMQRDYSPEEAAAATKAAVERTYRENGLSACGLLGVGVSVSAPVSPDGTVQRASIVPTWAGVNIRDAFEPVFGSPILADNESNCAAIAEMMWGAAIGCEDFVLFKIDLGVGGAIVSGGRVMTGIAGGAGEFGHLSLDPDGDLCRCGNRGCLELTASFNRPLEQLSRLYGRRMTMDDAIRLAEQGDVGARRLIEDTAAVAGRGLALVGTLINPPLIIIGGRMALAGDILLAPLVAAYEKHTLIKARDVAERLRTRITIGKFTENDKLLGAVGLVLRHHGRLD
ncbi:ROK family transcriptional regulator [Prosthecomicrobium pneumaticum]|uniref:Putative NBD/HSP70 family sugar kinase n=1 Tax=Prosthecomicrobium pneumaticum TaxID=81895 RepID=A0A7W9FLI7_9HYPH|nr:ROK family transcriptional regulator [Prosthecomicrobium pneumaticum]MBB5752875.1 putative NBD/HSP70 family sugar kinase [Prosthecomicrobium pneumaticum]